MNLELRNLDLARQEAAEAIMQGKDYEIAAREASRGLPDVISKRTAVRLALRRIFLGEQDLVEREGTYVEFYDAGVSDGYEVRIDIGFRGKPSIVASPVSIWDEDIKRIISPPENGRPTLALA